MHAIVTLDWSFSGSPPAYADHAEGLAHRTVIGRETGAVHTELAIARLAPGGWVDGHVHSYEQAIYVFEGEPTVGLDGRRFRLRRGDYALVPVGVEHSWANPGEVEARWMAVSTPLRVDPAEGRRDTFFRPGPADARHGEAALWTPGPTTRWVGHYDGTPPQADALRLDDPARGRRSAGRDTALVVYSGISVKMLVDRVFGAELLTMFTVDYEPGGSAQIHDHPFEEAYVFVAGEVDAILDGQAYRVRAGDVVFAGVGSTHGFFNDGPGRVRWIETQAPQPPGRHSYRWVADWEGLDPQPDG